MNDETEMTQAGFDAIANQMKRLYPDQKGIYYGTIIPYTLGGNDPLDGVEIWKSECGIPHWHYVTYGFTELYEKESDYQEESGYGFELTFRLKRENEEQPPVWPINLLQNSARYVFSSGNVFGPGHHMDCNSPVVLDTDTQLTALAFRVDPELGELDTPNGHMTFLQAVAITHDEMEALMCWDGRKFLAALEKQMPLCITDLARGSQMGVPAFHALWQNGMEQDGSSTGFFYLDELGANMKDGQVWLRLGAGRERILTNMLRARVGKGQSLYLQGENAAVQFCLGAQWEHTVENDVLILTLTRQALEELCDALQSHVGVYPLKSFPLTVELVPTRITDQDGNVLKVIE